MEDPVVIAKRDAAVEWCAQASEYVRQHRGQVWRYALIPHDAILENMTFAGLVQRFGAGARK